MPKIIVGLMGGSVKAGSAATSTDLAPFLAMLKAHAVHELDTARVYNAGRSEESLGQLPDAQKDFSIHTKAPGFSAGSLAYSAIMSNCAASLAALQQPQLDLYYFHGPDPATPLEESCRAIAQLHAQGKIARFGVSNFSPAHVRQIHDICTRNLWLTPSVYQGGYNALARNPESLLLPTLRELGMKFYAFSPLAGGWFSRSDAELREPPVGARMQQMAAFKDLYVNDTSLALHRRLGERCGAQGVGMKEAALRWLMHHSALGAEDGVILGGSSTAQMEENLVACAKGPLPEVLVQEFERLWEEWKEVLCATSSSCPKSVRCVGDISSQASLDLDHLRQLLRNVLLGSIGRRLVRSPRLELLLRTLDPRRPGARQADRVLGPRDAALAHKLRQRRRPMQRHGLPHAPLAVQLVDAADRLGEHIRERRDATLGPDRQPADQEIRLPAEHLERRVRATGELGREARDLAHGRARQLRADDLAGEAAREPAHDVALDVDAVADAGEVVHDDGQRAARRDLVVEGLHDARARRLAEVRARQHQRIVGARRRRVRQELEHLRRRVPAHARHERVRGPDGLARRVQQRGALFARQQEGLRVGAEDHQATEVRGEVFEVALLHGEVEGVVVEEGDGRRPDARRRHGGGGAGGGGGGAHAWRFRDSSSACFGVMMGGREVLMISRASDVFGYAAEVGRSFRGKLVKLVGLVAGRLTRTYSTVHNLEVLCEQSIHYVTCTENYQGLRSAHQKQT
nr:oxidoreductase siro [Quercus suber]